MNFEVLKRSHLKRNIVIGVVVVLILSVIILNFTKAKYRVTQSIPLVNGTINYSLSDLNIVALYIDGKEAINLDDNTKYTLDTTKSICTYKDGSSIDNLNLSYESESKTFTISPYTTKGTKCTLYFNEFILAKDAILANYSTVLTRDNFSTTVANTTTGTIYKSKDSSQYDDYGEVYYFAGNPTDNWIKFAGFYWRIIRINGDGTIRIIYNGTSSSTTGEGTQIGTSAFNSSYNNNMYVGYMYASNQIHGLETSSTIKGVLDTWYTSNLASQASKIDGNAGFCGDRTPSTSREIIDGNGGTETTMTFYAPFIRLDFIKIPTFECTNNSDLYTTSGSSNGNKALTNPIGLITADEVAYAGGVWGISNRSYYLYVNKNYWTISPSYFSGKFGASFYVYLDGQPIGMATYSVGTSYGVRPVINLKADVTISGGNGTNSNPYNIS